ncbi:MAG: FkbM family methyltransferase [Desulfurococcaceae archaeon]
MIFEIQRNLFELMENLLRVNESLSYFPYKSLLLKQFIGKVLLKNKHPVNIQAIGFWNILNLKYFTSKRYLRIVNKRVIFNYRGIKATMPLSWLYELVSMLDVLEKMSRVGCSIYSLDERHFIIDFSRTGVNVRMILPFPYSPHALYWTFIRRVFNEDVEDKEVVDVGAYIGDTTVWFAKKKAYVYAFEPFPTSFKYLKINCIINHVEDRVQLYPIAISKNSGRLKIRFNQDFYKVEGFGSLFSGFNEIDVDCWSLRDVLEKLGLDQCYLLKMDCEGCEFDVISNSIDVLPRFRKIILEYHIRDEINKERCLKNLLKSLKICGFRYIIKGNMIYAARRG